VSAYVPILAAEQSLLAGLAATSDAVKDRLTPLFAVPAGRRAHGGPGLVFADAAEPMPAPNAWLASVVDAVAAAFGRRRAYVDAEAVDHRRIADGRLATALLLDEARIRNLALVPVTGLRRSAAHQLAVADAASIDGRGVCLRLQLPDFTDLERLPERVLALTDQLGTVPEAADVLVDLGRVAAESSRVLTVAARAVLMPLRRAAQWRALAVAAAGGASGPSPDHASGPARATGDVERVPRTEWLLWRTLAADAPALGFGDYAGPSDGADDDGGAAGAERRAPWLGYARDAEWLVVRAAEPGDAPPRDGPPRDAPPRDAPLAPPAMLAERPEFYGDAHGAGDARSAASVAPATGPAAAPGGPDARLADWRAAAVTHHLTVTVEGIARVERADRA
jgi:hypothetical protein